MKKRLISILLAVCDERMRKKGRVRRVRADRDADEVREPW